MSSYWDKHERMSGPLWLTSVDHHHRHHHQEAETLCSLCGLWTSPHFCCLPLISWLFSACQRLDIFMISWLRREKENEIPPPNPRGLDLLKLQNSLKASAGTPVRRRSAEGLETTSPYAKVCLAPYFWLSSPTVCRFLSLSHIRHYLFIPLYYSDTIVNTEVYKNITPQNINPQDYRPPKNGKEAMEGSQ